MQSLGPHPDLLSQDLTLDKLPAEAYFHRRKRDGHPLTETCTQQHTAPGPSLNPSPNQPPSKGHILDNRDNSSLDGPLDDIKQSDLVVLSMTHCKKMSIYLDVHWKIQVNTTRSGICFETGKIRQVNVGGWGTRSKN